MTIDAIKAAIEQLSARERRELADWLEQGTRFCETFGSLSSYGWVDSW